MATMHAPKLPWSEHVQELHSKSGYTRTVRKFCFPRPLPKAKLWQRLASVHVRGLGILGHGLLQCWKGPVATYRILSAVELLRVESQRKHAEIEAPGSGAEPGPEWSACGRGSGLQWVLQPLGPCPGPEVPSLPKASVGAKAGSVPPL